MFSVYSISQIVKEHMWALVAAMAAVFATVFVLFLYYRNSTNSYSNLLILVSGGIEILSHELHMISQSILYVAVMFIIIHYAISKWLNQIRGQPTLKVTKAVQTSPQPRYANPSPPTTPRPSFSTPALTATESKKK